MTVEMVLIVSLWVYIILGVFLGDLGPIETFRRSGPRLAARIEKNLSTGRQFKDLNNQVVPGWREPAGTSE